MKTKRIHSGAPFACIGLTALLYAAVVGLGSWSSYAGIVILAFLLYAPLKRYFPDRFLVIETPPHTGNVSCDQLIIESRETLKDIYLLRVSIQRDSLTEKIDLIEQMARKILDILAQQPSMQGQLRTFLRYYLPTTLRLLRVRAEILHKSRKPNQTAQQTLQRIDGALRMIEDACERQLDALDQFQYLSIETEMDVLDDMLRRDGLMDEAGKKGAHAK